MDNFPNICDSAGLPRPETEHMFHPTRKWRIDYAFPSVLLAVECEGGIWKQGRHNRAPGFIADMEKYNALALEGWHLLRFTPDEMQIQNGKALRVILEWWKRHVR
jgi:very-short-patch-repair endonuclease